MEGYKLPNGRIEVGPELDMVLKEELDRLNAELRKLGPNVEKDIKESRKRHRKLWGY